MKQIKFSDLNMSSFQNHDSWQVLEETLEEIDISLIPADKNESGLISSKNGEVWCLSKMTFFNNEQHFASSMCRGDSNEGPILWSVWKDNELITLMLPPAPDFVLDIDGPASFCSEFNLSQQDIFPISFEVIPEFQLEPHKRAVLIYPDGTVTKA